MIRRRRLVHLGLALLAGLLFALLGSPASQVAPAAGTQTVVTIQFDDGVADQYGTLAILNAHGMHATFYVNTGFIGDSAHLSWTQVQDLAAAGNEIAGHTLTHANVKKLKPDAARQEICVDRQNLVNRGYAAKSFAYPFGSFDADAKAIVVEC